MEPQELVTVFTLVDHVKGEIIKNALQAEGIHCFLEGPHQAGGLIVEIKVQVPAKDADRARRFIESHEAPGGPKEPMEKKPMQ